MSSSGEWFFEGIDPIISHIQFADDTLVFFYKDSH